MEIKIEKDTNVERLRWAASLTSGKESKISLATAYRLGHSLMRTQMFAITLIDVPEEAISHLVRHVHAQPYVQSKRVDRGGEDFYWECHDIGQRIDLANEMGESDEQTQVLNELEKEVKALPSRFGRRSLRTMGLYLNAEEIISISKLRLCGKASQYTREVWRAVIEALKDVDPELAALCVPTCIYRGGICPEKPCCGFVFSEYGQAQAKFYNALFKKRGNV